MKIGNFFINWHYKGLQTTCTIRHNQKVGEQYPVIGTGSVKKTVKDAPNKDKARRLSMGKALQFIPKTERSAIWETYRTLPSKPRWGN